MVENEYAKAIYELAQENNNPHAADPRRCDCEREEGCSQEGPRRQER